MKKTITIITMLVLTAQMFAQQVPLFSEIYFMRMLYNPALAGYNGSSNLYGFYRNQWVNVPGHPVTTGAVGDMSLWKDRCAVGFDVYSDKTDIIHNINAQLYYAQKVRIAKDHVISLGVAFGIMQTYIDYNNAIATDPNDPHLLMNGKEGLAFNMNVGLAYQWKKLTVGFSVPQVLNTYTPVSTQENYTTVAMQRHYIGSVSYEISIADEKFNIEPSVQIKKGPAQPLQVDAGIMANYKRIAYLGVGYSLNYGVAIMGAVRISHVVTIGYAYDVPVMSQVTYAQTKGTHEVILGINFDKWLKKKGKDDLKYAKQSLVDSLMAKQDSLQKQVDSLAIAADSIQATQQAQQKIIQDQQKALDENQKTVQDQQKMIKDMQQQVDSFDNAVKQYKKNAATHPAKNFPSKISKDTKGKKGDIFKLSNVSFEKNSSFLNQSSFAELDKVVEFMQNNPNMQIRINGHTDYKASDQYNQWLSDRRAKRVYDYLVEQGAPADRLSYFGFGSKLPVGDNTTEEGRAQNRRVEIEVLK